MKCKLLLLLSICTQTPLYATTTITSPITISESAYVNFGTTLQFTITSTGQACITINANDVILDLNNFSFTLDESSTQFEVTGILVAPGSKNIEIKNGSVTNMTEYGIYISDATDTVHIKDFIINGAKKAGIAFDGVTGITNVLCENVKVENVLNMTGDTAYGLLLNHVNVANLTQCYINHTQTSTGNCYGVALQNCTANIVDNIMSSQHEGGGLEVAGFFLDNTNSCIIKNCFSINNTNTSTDPNALTLGFYYNGSQNHFLESCIAVGNTALMTSCGFKINNGVGVQLLECDAFANSSNALNGIGFWSSGGVYTQLRRCEAKGNSGVNNGYGVLFNNGLLYGSVEDCDLRLDTGYTGTSFGIYLDTAQLGYINHNTIAGHAAVGTAGYGIFDTSGAGTTTLITGNTAIKNTVNYSPGSPTIPVYSGTLSGTPGPFENISF